MPATTQVKIRTGTSGSPTNANAETGIKFNREDTQTGTTPIPVPTSTGTNFSWKKSLYLDVTASAATAISNRKVLLGSAAATGLHVWCNATATYAQATSTPTASGSNGAAPSGLAQEVTTTPYTYDASSVSAGSTGINGNLVEVALGVDNLYTGGASSNTALPDLRITYDEA